MIKNILMAGVGGQGIVLASNIVCAALLESGFDVKKSEIHGMAQRGGSVVSHVRFGNRIYSPAIPQGGADILVSFEYMEFLRYMDFVNEETVLILNNRRILPPSVAMGQSAYPEKEISEYKNKFKDVIELDADKMAEEAGNIKSSGTIMIGEICKVLKGDKAVWKRVIAENVPKKTIEVNLKAFESVF